MLKESNNCGMWVHGHYLKKKKKKNEILNIHIIRFYTIMMMALMYEVVYSL